VRTELLAPHLDRPRTASRAEATCPALSRSGWRKGGRGALSSCSIGTPRSKATPTAAGLIPASGGGGWGGGGGVRLFPDLSFFPTSFIPFSSLFSISCLFSEDEEVYTHPRTPTHRVDNPVGHVRPFGGLDGGSRPYRLDDAPGPVRDGLFRRLVLARRSRSSWTSSCPGRSIPRHF